MTPDNDKSAYHRLPGLIDNFSLQLGGVLSPAKCRNQEGKYQPSDGFVSPLVHNSFLLLIQRNYKGG